MKSQRLYHKIHKCVNRNAVKQTASNGSLHENRELSARGIEDRACYECDQEMQRATQSSGAQATLERVCAKQSAGDVL
jgi:hypothetical protein